MSKLDNIDRAMLDFEREWRTNPTTDKDRQIMDRFGMPGVEYYTMLADLITIPDALDYDPVTVQRLRREAQAVLDHKYGTGNAEVIEFRSRTK